MQQYPISPTPMMRLLNVTDTPLQTTLRQKLSTLSIEIAEVLQQQPTFHSFVQYEFDQDFPGLTPQMDLRRSFIKAYEKEAPSAETILEKHPQPASRTEQAQRTQAALPPEPKAQLQTVLEVKQEAIPLLPSLMDAVVQRIVGNNIVTYASRQASFYRAPSDSDDLESVAGITPEAFDTFLDRLAGILTSQYTHHLETFWNRPHGVTDSRTRKQWLVEQRAECLKAEVALLRADGLLSASSEVLFTKVLRYPDALARQTLRGYHPCAYGLALKDGASTEIPLIGAFVLTSRDQADAEVKWAIEVEPPRVRPIEPDANVGSVLLFHPASGLEEFDSLASLDRELHRRLNHAVEFTSVLALMAQNDQPRGLALHREGKERDQVKYIERLESIFSASIESQCDQVLQNFTSTVARYQSQGVQVSPGQLPQSLDRVTDLNRAFNAQGVLWSREVKRAQAQLKKFLREATQVDKDAWGVAVGNYCDELRNLPELDGLPSLVQFGDKSTLLAYSNEQLRIVLKAEHGLDVNPDNINVYTREPHVSPAFYVPGSKPGLKEPGQSLYKTRKRTLSELALENVGVLDSNFTNFSRLTDNTDSAYEALTPEQVKALVRTVNIGDGYEQFLKARLVTSPEAIAHKESYARVMNRQLRLDAIEAKIAGDFLPDRLERGFNWVRVVLDTPVDSDQREQVEGHRVLVQSLTLRGERVRGVLIFSAASGAVGSKVVYTPQAPGGRLFHEYASERLMSDFINHSSWRDYLLGRVGVAHKRQISALLRGRDATLTHMARIAGNILEDAYEVEANFAINDACAQSTTTHETNIDTAIAVATTVFDIATLVFPVKVMVPIGLARSMISVFNAVDAANLGDRETAAHYFVRAFGELVGAAADGAVGGPGSGAPRSVPRSLGLNPKMALGKKPQDLAPLAGWEGKGIYYRTLTGDGPKQYFLNDNSHWYSALYDDSYSQTWRVRDARKPGAYHHTPIRQNLEGQWEVGSPMGGLKGGNSPDRALMDLNPSLDEAQARRVFDSFVFPQGREIEFELSLVHYLRSGSGVPDIFHPYLLVTPERINLRIRGLDSSTSLAEVAVSGPSRPRPEAPPTARPPHERIVEWGQTIDPAEFQVSTIQVQNTQGQNVELSIHRRISGDQRLMGREYIEIDRRYYPILPTSRDSGRIAVFMRDPDLPFSTFEQLESVLLTDIFSQPRVAVFNPDLERWLNLVEIPFNRNLAAYVADAFPMFGTASQMQVARALFNKTNPTGLSAVGLAALQRTLQDWRAWQLAPRGLVDDPLLLLSRVERNAHGNWPLIAVPGRFSLLQFRTSQTATHLFNALSYPTNTTLRGLMIEVLSRSRYQIVSGPGLATELIFRRPGHRTVYCLTLRRTVGYQVFAGQYTAPNLTLMDIATRNLVTQAQASQNFVSLVGGVQLPVDGAAVNIFIFRV